MAKFFSGMSKDNFVDGLVAKSGMNGHELYDYLIELLEEHPKVKKETKLEDVIPKEGLRPGIEFCGGYQELKSYAKMAGVSDNMIQLIGASAPAFAACVMAAELKLKWFMWEKPSEFNPSCNLGMYNAASRKWDIMIEFDKKTWLEKRENFLDEKSLLI